MSARVYNGTEWLIADNFKVKSASAFPSTYKLKVRLVNSWLPVSQVTAENSFTLTWEVEAPTAPPPPIQYFAAPNVVGQTQTAANNLIQVNHNIGNVTYVNTGTENLDGLVQSQNPAATTLIAEDTAISYVLYNYVIPTFTMPNLNGLLKSNAENSITQLGGIVGALNTEETYDAGLLGRVKTNSQFPSSGSTQNINTSCTFIYYVQAPLTTVPNLVGTNSNNAYTALSNANLFIGTQTGVQTEDNNLSNNSTILSQSPAAGTVVAVDTVVNYSYYVPNTHVNMINIVGQTVAAATSLLTAKELFLGTETGQTTTSVANDIGKIKTQGIASGVSTAINTSINYTLWVAVPTTTVPNLSGIAIGNVASTLGGASSPYLFAGSTTTVQTTQAYLEGTVVPNSQSPASGTTVQRSTSVSYSYYVPNTTTTVPTITGLDTFSAGSTLTNAELVLAANPSSSVEGNVQSTIITSQSPAAGSVVAVNSTVNYGQTTPFSTVLIPSVVGLDEQSAKNTITNANLNWSVTDRQLSSGQSGAGNVYSQSPAYNGSSRVNIGSTINITVNRAYTPTLHTGTGSVTVSPQWGAYYRNVSGTRISTNWTNGLYVGSSTSNSATETFAMLSINAASAYTAMRNNSGAGSGATITPTSMYFNFNTGNMASGGSDTMDWRFYNYFGQLSSPPTNMTESDLGSNASHSNELQNPANFTSLTIYNVLLNSTVRDNMLSGEVCWPLAVIAFSQSLNHYTSINSPTFTIYYNWSAYY